MAKRTKPSPKFPQEVIFQVAQCLPDEASFFAFIEAMKGTTSGQGPIEAVWQLGQRAQCSWPHLELYLMKHEDLELAIQAIPVFSTVTMHPPYDLHRLVGRVSPSTNLVVIHDNEPDLTRMYEWFRLLVRLPVCGLVYTTWRFADRMPMVIPHLLTVWPSLTHLRCLELTVGDQASLESICKCIASSRITELSLEGQTSVDGYEIHEAPHLKLEGVVWTDLVAWLQSTRVVRFDLIMFRIICDDNATMQALNGALAASDAMQSILWGRSVIRISAPLVLPPQLQQLSLGCTFELAGIECIWKLLPEMPRLTDVAVATPLSPFDVDTLASVLAQSNVSYLRLVEGSIGSGAPYADCIQRLADAFEASASLRQLILEGNNLGVKGMKTILAAVERRLHVTKLVDLSRNCPEHRLGGLKDLIKNRMPPNTKIFV